MQTYRINRFIVKKMIEWKQIFLMDENYHKNKTLR